MVQPRKRFGQHFLVDPSVLDRIMDALSPATDDRVLEIGPGTGALTYHLLDSLNHLTVVELDRDLAQQLTDKLDSEKISVISKDILDFDFTDFALNSSSKNHNSGKIRVIGNLPYNISTPLLFHLIDAVDCIEDMIFMVQKEVALRLSAAPGSKNYGRLSVMSQLELECGILFDVPPEAFNPPPKVDSSVIRLVPKKIELPISDRPRLNLVVKKAFEQRRKTLRNALRDVVSTEQFDLADVDPGRRAETLTVEDFVRLANAV